MVGDEALREALVELKMLREREAEALRASNAIVDGLSVVAGSDRPHDALARLLASVQKSLDCTHVVLVKGDGDHALVEQAVDTALIGRAMPADVLTGRGVRRITDTAALAWWGEMPESLVRMRAALSARLRLQDGEFGVIMALSEEPAKFGLDCKRLLSRLADLAAQAIRTLSLSERNRLLAGVIDGSSASFAIADARVSEMPLFYVNDAFVALSGFQRAEVLGRNCRFLSDEPPDSVERTRLREAVRERHGGSFLLRNRRRDGSQFWNRLTLYPILGADGAVEQLVATQVDVTAEREAEAARDEARSRLVGALSATSEAFLLLDAAGRVVFSNRQFRDFFEVEDVVWAEGVRFEDAWCRRLEYLGTPRPHARRHARARLVTVMSGSMNREERLPDGRILLVNDRPLGDGGAVSIATDVTSLKATERILAQRAAAIDATQDGIAVTDEEGRFVYMNAAHLTMFGYACEDEILGQPWQSLYEPSQAAVIENVAVPVLQAEGTWRSEITGRARDGRPVEQEVSLTLLNGIGLVCVTRDISERQENERERARLRERLNTAQRQEAVAQLAAGVAHDFNNLLSVVTSSVALAETAVARGDDPAQHLARIRAAGTEAGALVSKMLDTGRKPGARRKIDLGETLRGAVELLRAGVPKRVALSLSLPDTPIAISADPADVLQVVLNLGINARDALGQNAGQIDVTLETAGRILADGWVEAVIGEIDPERRYARLVVRDTGPGMSVDDQGAIFTPYYTTKGAEGTGLGLAVVTSVVRQIGGALALESVLGKGSTFIVYWPLDERTATTAVQVRGQEGQPAAPRHILTGATVIVCDDVERVAEGLAAIIETAGAEAAVCTDPRDALEAVREDPAAWSLLLSDFDMPALDGAALAAAVREIRPDLPIVLCTALDREGPQTALFDAVVQKPVDPDRLLDALAEALAARHAGGSAVERRR
ncbi:MAG: PAS domain-containing protein [Pseudomonadota bacterium]